MEFRVLGPLEVIEGERSLPLGGHKQRAILAKLLIHANEVVPTDMLVDAAWGEAPPEGVANALQVHISKLRKALASPGPAAQAALDSRSAGYVLNLGRDQLDMLRFDRLVEEAREDRLEGREERCAARLRAALSLWRGPAFSDFSYEPFAQATIQRLEEMRISALEDRIEADLALGRKDELVPELEGLVAMYPLRERLRGHLMLALYRSQRQAEALSAYEQARRILRQELGVGPGPGLQRLGQAILMQDPSLQLSTSSKHATASETPSGVDDQALEIEPSVGFVSGAQGSSSVGTFNDTNDQSGHHGEQRPVTGLRADIVGSDALEKRLSRGGGKKRRPDRRVAVWIAGGVALVVLVVLLAWLARSDDGSHPRADHRRLEPSAHLGGPTLKTVRDTDRRSIVVAVEGKRGDASTIFRVDPTTFEKETIAEIRGTIFQLVADGPTTWILSQEGLFKVDEDGAEPVPIGLGGVGRDMAGTPIALWVAVTDQNEVVEVSKTADPPTLRSVPVNRPVFVAYAAGTILVASEDGVVTAIDPAAESLTNPPTATAFPPRDLTVTQGVGWIVSSEGRVERIDIADDLSLDLRHWADVGGQPSRLAPAIDGDAVWVQQEAQRRLTRVDARERTNPRDVSFPNPVANILTSNQDVVVVATSAGEIFQVGADSAQILGRADLVEGTPRSLVARGETTVLVFTEDGAIYDVSV